MQHDVFRHALINRFAGLLNTQFSTEYVLSLIEAKQRIITLEIEEHLARWRRPESLETWHENIDLLRTFATERPETQRAQWAAALNLPGTAELHFTISPAGSGNIRIHRSYIGQFSQETQKGNSIWTGTYFKGIPITYEAIPSEGLHFKGWKGSTTSNQNPITISPDSNLNIIAQFEPIEGIPEPMVTILDGNLVLSYHLTSKASESNYFWEHSRELKKWLPSYLTITQKETTSEGRIKISNTLPNLTQRKLPTFYRLKFRFLPEPGVVE